MFNLLLELSRWSRTAAVFCSFELCVYSFNKNNKIKNAWRPDATDKGIGLKSVKYIAVNEQLLRYCVVLTKH